MSDILLLKFGHLLCLVYWLGGDLGVFYSSYSVADERLSPETRRNAAKILFALDQAPRICMTLILPLGVHLAWRMGFLPVPGAVVAATWAICLGWLAMVLTLHFGGHGGGLAWLTKFDFGFRVVVVVGLLGVAGASLTDAWRTMPDWTAWKLAIFALLVFCGLMVRVRLKPFGPAFANLVRGEPSDEDNAVIRRTLGGTRPFVLAIWVGLLVETALGLHLLP